MHTIKISASLIPLEARTVSKAAEAAEKFVCHDCEKEGKIKDAVKIGVGDKNGKLYCAMCARIRLAQNK